MTPSSRDFTTLNDQNPWPGLAAYDETSSKFFFGRDEEADEVFRLIRLTPLTVVYGKSGLGKTSLLQAGLYPLLRAGHYLPVHLRVDFSATANLPPFQQVMQRFKEELDSRKADYPPPHRDEGLWEYLHRKGLEIWSPDNYLLTPVLVFDQFEELFSPSDSDSERISKVFDGLEDLIENLVPSEIEAASGTKRSRLDVVSQRYRIVLSFREDFLAEVKTWERMVPSLLRNCLRLDPMFCDRAIEAVEKAGNAVLCKGVATSIVDFIGKLDRPEGTTASSALTVEPVLLSLCCYQLNRRRKPEAKIDESLVLAAGQDILDRFYREALDDPAVKGPPEVAVFIEDYLIQGDFRGAYPKKEALTRNLLTKNQLDALIDKHRLLRIVPNPDTARVELIHDRLVPVVRKTRDERRINQQRQMDLLAERQAAAKALAEEQRRATERAEADAARLEKSRSQLAVHLIMTEAEANLSGTRPGWSELGLLKLLAAYRIAPHVEIEGVMLAQVLAFQRMEKIVETGSPVSAVAFSPDGTRLASGSSDETLRLWDVQTGQRIGQPLRGHGGDVLSVVFSPDGTRLASGGYDGTVRLWNAKTNQPLGAPLQGHEGSVWSVAFSPDGTRLASGGYDGTVRLWNAQNGQRIGKPMRWHEKGQVRSVAFSPDGTRLVSGGEDNTLRLWPAPKVWPDLLCAKLTRNMSRKEWREQVSPDIEYHEQCPGLPIPPDAHQNH